MSQIVKTTENWAKKNMADIQREWNQHQRKGDAEISFRITQDTPDEVIGEYRASGQGMWTIEYGRGSKLDRNNPFLSEYENSSFFNPERINESDGFKYAVRTRKGVYQDLDGNWHEGSGIGGDHGLNLEHLKRLNNSSPVALEPLHTIEETLTGNTAINEQFKQDLLNSFGAQIKETISKVTKQ